MSSIDQRVVHMTFDNKQFEQSIATTLGSLDKLNKGLQLQGATKGLTDVDKAAKGVSLSSLASGITGIADKFRAMSIVGITALTTIANKAVNAGLSIVKSFTLDPITAGFHNYETQINAVQTILANTAASGTKLKDVTKALAELNTYANQTVYNFSDMAKNIGTFTAAGVGLKTSVASIKGIANLAAMSGSTADQASTAMYQLSQAIATGTVHLMDWNSVVNAGMGGKTFQTALINTARSSGVAIDSIIKKAGSFRDSLQKGWLTSSVLTKTLSQFTGDLSLKQIEAMGYTKKQAEAVLAMGKVATDAATKIKTFTQLTDALKEEVATAYATIFKTIFGNITQATTLWSGIHSVAENALTKPIYDLNTLLQGWDKLGGRKVLIQGLSDAFKILSSVMKIIGSAFREIFPPTTAKQLYDMTVTFRDFIERLKMGGATADELKRTFAGVFAILKIGWDIISAVGSALFGLFGTVSNGSGGFLKFTASVGDFLVKLKTAIEQSGVLTSAFSSLANFIAIPIQLIQLMGVSLGSLFGKFDGSKATKSLSSVSDQINSLGKYSKTAIAIWSGFTKLLDTIWKRVDEVAKKVSDFFHNLGTGGSTTNTNFGAILAALDTGLFGGLILLVRKVVKYFTSGEHRGPISTIIESITAPFEELTNTLKTMQSVLKAATLLEIAAAVSLLAIAMSILSKIDQAGLIRSSVAITIMFGQLIGSMALFQKFVGTAGFAKLPFMMLSMLLLAGAVDVLASAVAKLAKLDWNGLAKGLSGLAAILGMLLGTIKLMGNPTNLILAGLGLSSLAGAIAALVTSVTALSGLSWNELAKGLVGVATLLGSLILFTKFSETDKASLIQTAGIVLLAGAIKILVSSVKDFSGLGWEQIGKGLSGVAALLGSLVLYTKFSKADTAGLAQGAGIVLLASGIKILVSSVKDFDGLGWEGISKGLVGVATLLGSLLLYTKFSKIGTGGIAQGIGLVLLAASIKILVSSVQDFSKMGWEPIAKGLITLAGALGIITGALDSIPPTAPLQASGVLLVAISLGLVADALQKLGSMSWMSILKGVIALDGSLGVISAALDAISPAAPLGAAAVLIVAISMGMVADVLAKMGAMSWTSIAKSLIELAFSLGIIVDAMDLMPVALPGAAALIVVAVALNILSPVLQAFGKMSLGEIVKSLLMLAGVFVILGLAGLVLGPVVPVILLLATSIAILGAGVLLAGLGLSLFAGAIKVLGQNLTGFGSTLSHAGSGIVKGMGNIIKSMAMAIVNDSPKVVAALLKMLLQMIQQMDKYIPKLINAGSKLVVDILNGFNKNIPKIATAATNLCVNFLNTMGKNTPKIIDAGVKFIISFVNGLAKAIRANSSAMGKAGANLGTAIVTGLVSGLGSGLHQVVKAAEGLATSAINAAKGVLKSSSPSKVFIKIGQDVNEGFYIGLTSGSKSKVDQAFTSLKDQLANAINSSGKQVDSLTSKLAKLESARKKDTRAISDTKKALSEALSEHNKELAAYDELTKGLTKQHTALDKLATSYATVTTKLQAANTTLANAIKTRDDFNKQITDQYQAAPQFTASATLTDYQAGLKDQIEKTKEFANVLQRLRKLGLGDTAYKEFLNEGVTSLPIAQQLLDSGKNGVNQLNSLDSQLNTAAAALGKTASTTLYQAAVDSAQGLVDGLKKQQKSIEKQMVSIADAMVKAIKKELGIKSPSTVFAEVGGYSAQGLAQGLDEMSGIVETSAAAVGKKAVTSLSKSISGFSDLISGPIEINPTITPVLDLSGIKKDAGQIGTMLGAQPISVDATYSKAASASAGYASNQVTPTQVAPQPAVKQVTYNQYNNSPKALSAADIYRQTKNQLSQVRGVLVYQSGGTQ